jgi:L-alanine-DL-glutamate epimerase-like enolase superfamily enzyme
LRHDVTRTHLKKLLPAGGARNAVDCALWDLEAKRAGRRAWELAGIDTVHPVLTNYTLGVGTPGTMGRSAAALTEYSLLKLKLAGEGDIERVTEVRKARPAADIIVDCNQAWTERLLYEFVPRLAELGVKLIEQPLPKDNDAALMGFQSPIPLCADESYQSSHSMPAVLGKYQYVNIKLDKTGGLTEALEAAHTAKAAGLKLIVGAMGGSSLSMAPGFIVGQLCEYADLDSPLLMVSDVADGVRYERSHLLPPAARLWG